MDSDTDESSPIVPHNSVVDCRLSPAANPDYAKKERRDPPFYGYKPVRTDKNDGKAAINSLKNRLYDRPENSEVFRAILRPVQSSQSQVQVSYGEFLLHEAKPVFITTPTT